MLDGSAKRAAELIQVERRLVLRVQDVNRIRGIENVVAQEVVGISVEPIRA